MNVMTVLPLETATAVVPHVKMGRSTAATEAMRVLPIVVGSELWSTRTRPIRGTRKTAVCDDDDADDDDDDDDDDDCADTGTLPAASGFILTAAPLPSPSAAAPAAVAEEALPVMDAAAEENSMSELRRDFPGL